MAVYRATSNLTPSKLSITSFNRNLVYLRCKCSSSASSQEVLEAAWTILENFNKNDMRGAKQQSLQDSQGISALRSSIVVAAEAAVNIENSKPLISICAQSSQQALESLQHWTLALGYHVKVEDLQHFAHVQGPVYLKYNVSSEHCYTQPYQGDSRGIILQLGERQVGHLPLFLFATEK